MPIGAKNNCRRSCRIPRSTVQAVHKRIKNLGLKESKGQNRIFFGHDTARKIIEPKVKQLKIATSVVRWGIKPLIAEALAVKTCLYGLRASCVDVDQQAKSHQGSFHGQTYKECPVMIDLVEGRAKVEEWY